MTAVRKPTIGLLSLWLLTLVWGSTQAAELIEDPLIERYVSLQEKLDAEGKNADGKDLAGFDTVAVEVLPLTKGLPGTEQVLLPWPKIEGPIKVARPDWDPSQGKDHFAYAKSQEKVDANEYLKLKVPFQEPLPKNEIVLRCWVIKKDQGVAIPVNEIKLKPILDANDEVEKWVEVDEFDDPVAPINIPDPLPFERSELEDLGGPPAPQLDPTIGVSPLDFNFGDIDVGVTSPTIVTVMNTSEYEELIVWDIHVAGDEAFSSDIPSLPIVLSAGDFQDISVTFAPGATGKFSGELVIESDATLHPSVSVALSGTGTESEPPPSVTVEAILQYFDDSVADGTLFGNGPGNSAAGRLKALRNMIEAAGDLIDKGEFEQACQQLWDACNRCDGQKPPPDFVCGPAAGGLEAMILELLLLLECS